MKELRIIRILAGGCCAAIAIAGIYLIAGPITTREGGFLLMLSALVAIFSGQMLGSNIYGRSFPANRKIADPARMSYFLVWILNGTGLIFLIGWLFYVTIPGWTLSRPLSVAGLTLAIAVVITIWSEISYGRPITLVYIALSLVDLLIFVFTRQRLAFFFGGVCAALALVSVFRSSKFGRAKE